MPTVNSYWWSNKARVIHQEVGAHFKLTLELWRIWGETPRDSELNKKQQLTLDKNIQVIIF